MTCAADGKNVVRGSFGRSTSIGIITRYYLAAIQAQADGVFLTQSSANAAVGVGALANYVYGVCPLPPVPTNIDRLPEGRQERRRLVQADLQDFPLDQLAMG